MFFWHSLRIMLFKEILRIPFSKRGSGLCQKSKSLSMARREACPQDRDILAQFQFRVKRARIAATLKIDTREARGRRLPRPRYGTEALL
jgi:hypothetical protein